MCEYVEEVPHEDDGEEHPWEWLVELLAAQGVTATAGQLRAVPYDVELGPVVRERLSGGA